MTETPTIHGLNRDDPSKLACGKTREMTDHVLEIDDAVTCPKCAKALGRKRP